MPRISMTTSSSTRVKPVSSPLLRRSFSSIVTLLGVIYLEPERWTCRRGSDPGGNPADSPLEGSPVALRRRLAASLPLHQSPGSVLLTPGLSVACRHAFNSGGHPADSCLVARGQNSLGAGPQIGRGHPWPPAG